MRLRVLIAALLLAGCGAAPTQPAEHVQSGQREPSDPVAVLHTWDAARADAWAEGDVDALSALYVTGSSARRADVAALRRWTARGFTVHGLRMQVLRVRVEVARADVLRFDLVDRLAAAEARSADVVRRLPASAPVRRTVELRRYDGRWQVLAVRPWRPAGPR